MVPTAKFSGLLGHPTARALVASGAGQARDKTDQMLEGDSHSLSEENKITAGELHFACRFEMTRESWLGVN